MKKLLCYGLLLATMAGNLYAQEVKEPVPAQKPPHPEPGPLPEMRPPRYQQDSVSKSRLQQILKIKTSLKSQRDSLIKIITDATYYPNYVPIASHRAQYNGGTAPENSMPAIYDVIATNSIDIVELDIKKSSDDTVYVMHDNYLQRTTDFLDKFPGIGTNNASYGHYNWYTWTQVKTLTLKRADFTYTDEVVPTFRFVLQRVRDRSSVLINLDIGDPAVFEATWNVVKQEDAFDVCIFKSAAFTVAEYKTRFYDPLPAAQKAKVIFFPMIVMSNPGGLAPMAAYQAWENAGLAKGYELGYRGDPAQNTLLDVVDAIHARRRVRVHVFNTLPDVYRGRYKGNLNTEQCCNDAYDARGDWEYLFNPRQGTKGANGYVITDDPVMLGEYLGQ